MLAGTVIGYVAGTAIIFAVSHEEPLPRCWRIESDKGYGSAVAVAPGWLLTAHHLGVPMLADDVEVVEVHNHPNLDLMLCRINEPTLSVRIAHRAPSFGARLRALGYHDRRYLLMTDGRQGMGDMMTCAVVAGCSGGPVLNKRGELVGITAGVLFWHAHSPLPVRISFPMPHISRYTAIDKGVRAWIAGVVSR